MKILKKRNQTKKIQIKDIYIGGDSSIKIQSMCNIPTEKYNKVYKQIKQLENAGCDIIRVSVKNDRDIESLKKLIKNVSIPVVADIHFDYKLALKSVKAGVHKLRINPGNIKDEWKIKEIVKSVKDNNIPIRVGVNFGSLEKKLYELVEKGKLKPEQAIVKSALKEIELLENLDFNNIIVSLKTSDVITTLKSYKLFSKQNDYPLHIGVTESGTLRRGLIKSAVGISNLLINGIGDTIRVSLSTDPIEEIYAAINILQSIGLKKDVPELISCPSCGRTQIDLIGIADKVDEILYKIKKPVKVAVMGCVVNGPGEAKEADIGVTGGNGVGVIFKKGKIIRKVKEKDIIKVIEEELKKL